MLLALFAIGQALVVSIGDLIIGVQTVSKFAFVGTAVLVSLGVPFGDLHVGDLFPTYR